LENGTDNDLSQSDYRSVDLADTDGDGIPDNIDLDDDNDGILDVNECEANTTVTFLLDSNNSTTSKLIYTANVFGHIETVTITAPATHQGLLDSDGVTMRPNKASMDPSNGHLVVQDYGHGYGGVDNESVFEFNSTIPLRNISFNNWDDFNRNTGSSTGDPKDAFAFTVSGTWKVTNGADLASYDPQTGAIVGNNPAGNADGVSVDNLKFGDFNIKGAKSPILMRGVAGAVTDDANVIFTANTPFTHVALLYEDVANDASNSDNTEQVDSDWYVPSFTVTFNGCDLDTDKDGISNYLDLDSDNDGIPDNVEAQPTAKYKAPIGSVDANGTWSAIYGMNGIIPVDTDKDNITDMLDSDSDNDNISDCLENNDAISICPITTAMVGTNGLASWAESADDYKDTNGFAYDNVSASFTLDDTDDDTDLNGMNAISTLINLDYRDNATAPIAMDDNATGVTSNPTTIAVLTNDSDIENDINITSIALVGADANNKIVVPNEGTWSVNTLNEIVFTPLSTFTGDPTPVKYNITDKTGLISNEATVTVDYPQTATSSSEDNVTAVSGSPIVIDVLANDTDTENDTDPTSVKIIDPTTKNQVTTLTVPNEGTWSVDPATGKITFSPVAGFTGDPTPISYVVSDTTGNTSNPVAVNIDYPQTAPVAKDDNATAVTRTPTTISVLTNDTDIENDINITSIALVGADANNEIVVQNEGTWSVNTLNEIVFTPLSTFTGDPAPINYTVTDKTGLISNEATVTVDYPQTATSSSEDNVTAVSGNPITIDVLANDSDDENDTDPTTVKIMDGTNPVTTLTVPNEGTWKVNPTTGEITFTPEAGFTGDPTPISYVVSDTTGNISNPVAVNIDYPQTAPVAVDDNKTGVTAKPTTIDVLGNDTDAENDINVTSIALVGADANSEIVVPNEGTWAVNTLNEIVFTPLATFTGDPTPVKYTITDKIGLVSKEATVRVDYPQTATSSSEDNVTAVSGSPIVIDVLANDTDTENDTDPTTVKIMDGTNPVTTLTVLDEGTWEVNATTGKITFTPVAGFTGDPTPISYVVSDTTGNTSNPVAVNIDYPQTAPISNEDNITAVNGNPIVIDVLTNDSDDENDIDPTSVKIMDGTPLTSLIVDDEGTWEVNATTGVITFTPKAGFVGDPTPISYVVSDTTGMESNLVNVNIFMDFDNDGIANKDDLDDDNDGILDTQEEQGTADLDTDGDGIPDRLDLDSDNDGILDLWESGADFSSLDTNSDGILDSTVDADKDGVMDTADEDDNDATSEGNITPIDTDEDGIRDFQDVDSDNDGIADLIEVGVPFAYDSNNDGMIDTNATDENNLSGDSNFDGVFDIVDNDKNGTAITMLDKDGDGTPNYRDLDSDNDGLSDVKESGAVDSDGDGIYELVEGSVLPDSNHNGIPNYLERYVAPTPPNVYYEDTTVEDEPSTVDEPSTEYVEEVNQSSAIAPEININPIQEEINPGEEVTLDVLESASGDIDSSSLEFTIPNELIDLATLSGDKKELIVNNEGVWTIDESGLITFTPEEGFLGEPSEILYTAYSEDGTLSQTRSIVLSVSDNNRETAVAGVVKTAECQTSDNIPVLNGSFGLILILLTALFGIIMFMKESKK